MKIKKTVYVFLVRRKNEQILWPCVVARESIAERFPGRATEIVTITFSAELPHTSTPGDVDGIPLE